MFGLLSLVAGGYVLTNPGLSLATFVWLNGVWMIAYGGLVITTSFLRMR